MLATASFVASVLLPPPAWLPVTVPPAGVTVPLERMADSSDICAGPCATFMPVSVPRGGGSEAWLGRRDRLAIEPGPLPDGAGERVRKAVVLEKENERSEVGEPVAAGVPTWACRAVICDCCERMVWRRRF